MNLDSSKVSGTDCIPVAVLKNCEPELSYIIVELFNIVWMSLVFQIVGRSHQWSLYLRMSVKGLQLKTTVLLAFFMWTVNSLSSRSAADLLTVESDIIASAFKRSGAIQAVALDISKTFWKGLACWSSSQTSVLWSFRSVIWPYFFFSQ